MEPQDKSGLELIENWPPWGAAFRSIIPCHPPLSPGPFPKPDAIAMPEPSPEPLSLRGFSPVIFFGGGEERLLVVFTQPADRFDIDELLTGAFGKF